MYPQKKRRSKKAIYKAQIRRKLIRVVLGLCILSLASVGVLRLAVPNVFSAINKQLNYQGKLRNSAGITVPDGAYNMKFTIYDAASGGNVLWTARESDACGAPFNPAAKSVTISNGVFSTMLGESGDCPLNLDFNSDSYYLGLTVESDSEMTPRKRIGAAGYAFNADLLDGLNTSAAGGSSAFVPVTDGSGHLTLTQNFILGGVMKNADGSAASPSYTFSSGDSNDGFYYYGADTIGVTVGGVAAGRLAGSFYYDSIYSNTAVTLTLKGQVADGASAVGATIGSNNTLSTSGAKLVSFVNNTTEKAYIDKDGNLYAPGANFSGLSASSAVYTDASKNLTTTAPTSGTLGYWSRTGTTLSPATANDVVSVTGSGATAITGTSSAAGGKGIYGTATETSNTPNYGGYFTTAGGGTSYLSASAGVYGAATNTGDVYNFGGYFTSAGANNSAAGVFASASDTGAFENTGGIFISQGQSGRGVYGLAYNSGASSTYGVKGQANSTGSGTSGVYGYVGGAGDNLRGVFGEAGNTGAYINYGGYFIAAGTGFASGVYGEATGAATVYGVSGYASSSAAVSNYGGYFTASGTGMGASGVVGSAGGAADYVYGVQGVAGNTGAYTNYGGYFYAQGETGRGVYGEANNTVSTNYGGYFTAAGTGGSTAGVYGASTATGGFSPFYGGYFTAAGTYGVGVYGYATASSFASGYGVYGQSDGDYGVGVRGLASSDGGANYGGYFWSNGPGGSGVYARATGTGTTYGVYGVVNSSSGWAGYFEGGQGLYADYARINNLSASAAVYTDASGFLTTTAPSSGALGYWDRAGATLSPYNADDIVSVSTSTVGATAVAGITTANYGVGVSGAAQGDSVAANYGGYFTAVGTGGGTAGVYAEAAGAASYVYGVQGLATGTGTVENYGGYFYAAGNSGRAVYGLASASGAVTNYGGYFEAQGNSGQAVYGLAGASGAVTNYGGFFRADGDTGSAVFGWATSASATVNYGGQFIAGGTGGAYGVYGEATGLTGTNYGVYGKGTIGVYGTNGSNYGELGYASAGAFGTDGTRYGQLGTGNYGVYGYYDSNHYGYIGSANYGVYGYGGNDSGVYGEATTGYGVYGQATSAGAYANRGGYFYAAGSNGAIGVFGIASNGSGVNYGAAGFSQSTTADTAGVYGEASGAGSSVYGVRGYASSTATVKNVGGYFTAAGTAGSMGVYGEASSTGNVENHGGYFTAGGYTGKGVYGEASYNSTSTLNYGGHFVAKGQQGIGVFGVADYASTSTVNYGGYFTAAGTGTGTTGTYGAATASGATVENRGGHFIAYGGLGYGVIGSAPYNSTSTLNYGGYFTAGGQQGVGVFGSAPYNSTSTVNYGGAFTAAGTGTGTTGVYSAATATGATVENRGGHFIAYGGLGYGVIGSAPYNSTSTTNYGGYFIAAGTGAGTAGVYGLASGAGKVYGAYGEASATGGAIENYGGYFIAKGGGDMTAGVYGEATQAGYNATFGGYFKSSGTQPGSAGVVGTTAAAANAVAGVMGVATDTGALVANMGGYFEANGGGGYGIYAITSGSSGWAGYFNGGQGIFVESGTANQINSKLGIGISPSAVLDVYGAGGASALARIQSSSDAETSITFTTPYRVWRVGQNFSTLTDRFTIYDQTAAAARFVIDTSGRIGAGGVTTPSYSFDIDNSSYARTIDATNSYSNGIAIYGESSNASASTVGVYGYSSNTGAYAHYGGWFVAAGTGGAHGVYGQATGGSGANMGVYGTAGSGYGGYFTGSASYAGVYANTIKIAATGVAGQELDVEGQIQFNLDGTTDTLIGVCKNVADGGGVESNVEFRDCSSTPGDIAEWYDTTGTEPGDIVAATDDTVTFQGDMFDPLTGLPLGIQETLTATILTPSAEPYQTSLLGVISTNPIQSFGQGAIDVAHLPNPMTVTGRAPTKVSTENGVIRPGDPITSSSTAGVGMKATKPGMIIGYAVDHYTGAGVGQILVNINPGWHSGFTINTDGVVSMFDDNFTFNKIDTADEVVQGYNSKGLTFRGSGWDGAAAQNVEMRLNNVVTDALNYKLSVLNNAGSEVAYIDQAGALGLSGKFYPATPTGAQTDAYIFYRNNCMRTNAAGWATGSFDFAEMFLSRELLDAGDVVVLDEATNEYVKKSTAAYDNMALGIVSTEPGFLAGANVDFDDPSADQGYPIALAGRVPTKVSVENGPIRPGDFLTTSATPGVAMKATEAGLIIGTALESFDGPGVGLVKVFVNLAWYNVLGEVTPVEELAALTLTGDLDMNGHYILNVGKIVGLDDKWSIDENGILKVKLIAEDLGEKEMFGLTSDKVELTLSGSSRLENGTKMIDLSFIDPEFIKHISAETSLKVIVTLNEPANGIYVAEKAAYSFRVAETNAGTSDAAFDWIVIARRKGYEDPSSEPAPTEPASSEPAPTEPAPSEPAPTEPAPSEPAPTEPAPSEPAPTEPAPSEPAPTEPAPSEPAPTEPAPSE